jgi:hypothetical protein
MTSQIEDQLRATLHKRAGEIPNETIARIVTADYDPRTQRRIRRPALTALTGGTALAGAAGAAVALLGGASPAFAGWTKAPTAPTPGQLQQAASDCAARLPLQGLPLQLSDTRGPFTFEIYANDQSSATCINGPSFTSVSGEMASAPVTTPPDQLGLTTQHSTGRDGADYTFVEGRAGASVTGATLNLADGSTVEATVQHGWFVAWWPGASDATSATVTTTGDGTQTQTFPAPKTPPPGGTSTTGTSTSGTSTNGTGPGPGAVSSYGSASGSSGGGPGSGYSFNSQSVK